MGSFTDEIKNELKKNSELKNRESGKRFFKEEVFIYGAGSASVKKICKDYYDKLKEKSTAEIFTLCEELFSSGYLEESFIACNWSYFRRNDYKPEHFNIFENWVGKYIKNWASCDTLCNHTIGAFIDKYPEYISSLKKWALSDNRWMRRASAVSLIIPAREGRYHDDILMIADILLLDKDDLVQKGYGWMLKAASDADLNKIYNYVESRKSKMPRTALRYAIEKMPADLKKKAMSK